MAYNLKELLFFTLLGSSTVLAYSPLTYTPPSRFVEYPEGRPSPDPPQLSKFRLPTDVIPQHYDLQIRPILTNDSGTGDMFTAPGHVKITLKCVKSTNNIVLHADELDIEFDTVTVRLNNFNSYDHQDHLSRSFPFFSLVNRAINK